MYRLDALYRTDTNLAATTWPSVRRRPSRRRPADQQPATRKASPPNRPVPARPAVT